MHFDNEQILAAVQQRLSGANIDSSQNEASPDPAVTSVSGETGVQEPVTESVAQGPVSAENILAALPEILRPTIKPLLDQMQQPPAVDNSLYDPYKEFIDGKINPAELQQGLQLLRNLNGNPTAFYSQLGAYLGQNQQQASPPVAEVDLDVDFSDEDDPRFVALASQQKKLQEMVLQQQAASEAKAAEAWAARALEAGKTFYESEKRNLPFNPEFIIPNASVLMNQGIDPDVAMQTAVQKWIEVDKSIAPVAISPPVAAPPVLPAVGGAPPATATVDFKKLNPEERNKFAAQMLASMLGQRG